MRFPASLVVLSLFVAAVPVRAQLVAPAAGGVSADSISTLAPSNSVPVTTKVDEQPTATVATPAAGASLTGLRSAVHTPETARALRPNAAVEHANLGQSRAMMIVGVAGLIAGAIIGGTPGTIVMVGGAVIGLVGLYDYLQ